MTTNEPAFPSTNQGPTTAPEIYYGITIRDYFAAKAMQSYLLDKTGIVLRLNNGLPHLTKWPMQCLKQGV